MTAPSGASYREPVVTHDGNRIHVRDHPGDGPPVVLLHGFPDSLHLYDRLVPHLAGRRVVTFDFLGWGDSAKPAGYRPTAASQALELDAVIEQLGLDRVVIVPHDSSGPPAIDWALDHPERVAALVLLNTFYLPMAALKRPPAIALYSTPLVRTVARRVARASDGMDRRLFHWQVGRFISDPEVRAQLVPLLYSQFRNARPAFWALNDDLLRAVAARRRRAAELERFAAPVRIVFGGRDRWMNPGVAARFHDLFPLSELFVLGGARHYVQVDEPAEVARLILSAPLAPPPTPVPDPPGRAPGSPENTLIDGSPDGDP